MFTLKGTVHAIHMQFVLIEKYFFFDIAITYAQGLKDLMKNVGYCYGILHRCISFYIHQHKV